MNKLSIQTSKHLAIPIIAAIIVLRKNAVIVKLPKISDVTYMLNVGRQLGFYISHEANRTIFFLKHESKIFDLSNFAGNIRQNILLLPLCSSHRKTIFPIPEGDVIGKRPFTGYLNLINKFGYSSQFDNKSIIVMRETKTTPMHLNLDIDSTGITVVSILMILKNVNIYRSNKIFNVTIKNVSVDFEIHSFIQWLNINSDGNLIAFSPERNEVNINLGANLANELHGDVPIDRVVLFDTILFSRLFNKDVYLENLSKIELFQTLGIGLSTLDNIGVDISEEEETIKISAREENFLEKCGRLTLIAGKYPDLSTDMLPLLTTYYTLKGIQVEVVDQYFVNRVSLLASELNKLNTKMPFVFKSTNIRQTLCGIMVMLFTDKVGKVIDYDKSLYRGYERNIILKIEQITGSRIKTIESDTKIEFIKWN